VYKPPSASGIPEKSCNLKKPVVRIANAIAINN
jgi:hypothetical protein